jgi:FAD/FMN-containing dehydrogenase
VIDGSRMNQVMVDPLTRVARVAAGATSADLLVAAKPHGLVAVTGSVGTTGFTGLILAGGYSALSGKYGLALDNLLGAEVVLADGTKVVVNQSIHADLFWALRGGGGNFGVVTSMRVQLHRQGDIHSGVIAFAWNEARSVLLGLGEVIASAPDDFDVLTVIVTGQDGTPLLLLIPTWAGAPDQGESVVAAVRNLGTPVMDHMGPVNYADMVTGPQQGIEAGNYNAFETRWLPTLSSDIVDGIVAAIDRRTSSLSKIVLHDFHGAPTRVAPAATAFGLRQRHILVEIMATWSSPQEDGNLHRQWAENLSGVLAPHAFPGGYANMLGPKARTQTAQAYGNNLERLREIKKRYDPEGVFSAGSPITV